MTNYISLEGEIDGQRVDIYKILFESIFNNLLNAARPDAEFSLLGRNMIDGFDRFFIDRIDDPVHKKILEEAHNDFLTYESLKKPTKDVVIECDVDPLPYAIKRFEITNFYGIIKTCVKDMPVNAQWIFLTGENSFGKTAVLRALVIGLLGDVDGKISLTREPCKISVEFKNRGRNQINVPRTLSHKKFTKFAAYGPSRLIIQSQLGVNEEEGKSSITYSLFNNDGVLLNIETELSRWFFKDKFKRKFTKVRKALRTLLPNIADIRVDENTDDILYIECDEEGGNYGEKPFRELASGDQSILAMVGDMMLRLFEQHPDEDDPGNLSGVVIIDELDLHFHPKWQRNLPIILSKTFPKVQFIVSTHSVIPFLGAPLNSVFLKVTRNKSEGVQLEKLDIVVQNLLPNTILTSPIFDFDNLIPHANGDLSALGTEDAYDEKVFNDILDRKLTAIEKRGTSKLDGLFDPGTK